MFLCHKTRFLIENKNYIVQGTSIRLLHASETWTTTKADERKVAIFEMKVLRNSLKKKIIQLACGNNRPISKLGEMFNKAFIITKLKSQEY